MVEFEVEGARGDSSVFSFFAVESASLSEDELTGCTDESDAPWANEFEVELALEFATLPGVELDSDEFGLFVFESVTAPGARIGLTELFSASMCAPAAKFVPAFSRSVEER